MHYKPPFVFEPQPDGGFTVTSPLLPGLVTEGDSFEEALENVRDALDWTLAFTLRLKAPRSRPSGAARAIASPRHSC